MREPVKFNINGTVRVKLTDKGRAILHEQHLALFDGHTVERAYKPYPEDVDGWSEWQLCDLMARLGGHVPVGGFDVPFYPDIELLP